MLPTRLNLLSPQKKQFLRHLVTVQFLRHLLELALFLTVLVCIMFLGGEWVLENHFSSVGFNHTLVTSGHSKINQEIQKINKQLGRVQTLQKQFHPQSPLVYEVMKQIPPGIDVHSADFTKSTIIISGKATSREILLALRDNLTTLTFVQGIDIPLSNLTEKENVEFVLTIKK